MSRRNAGDGGVHSHHRRRRRHRHKPKRGTVAIIDDLLLRQVDATLNGEPQRVRTIDAITLQLLEKAVSAGSPRAWKVLMKFEEFAQRRVRRNLRIEFVENEYTKSLSRHRDE